MVHYATAIEKYGSLTYLWCMRFEAKHNDSKIYFFTALLEIEIDHSQKPARREDFDDDFRIFSMKRSWPTFEIENTEIKNARTVFSLSVVSYHVKRCFG